MKVARWGKVSDSRRGKAKPRAGKAKTKFGEVGTG
jgi:hypothetical protein